MIAHLLLGLSMVSAAVPAKPSTDHDDATFPETLQGMWAKTPAECEPEMTGAMLIGANRIEYYEGWDDLIAIEQDDIHHVTVDGTSVMVTRLSYTHADGPQPARSVTFESGMQELHVNDTYGRHRYIRCPPHWRD